MFINLLQLLTIIYNNISMKWSNYIFTKLCNNFAIIVNCFERNLRLKIFSPTKKRALINQCKPDFL